MIIGPYTASNDEFHPPADPDDPEWTETCWFTFTVPERRLSGQLYPFFKPTLGVTAAGAYFWDDTGDQIWNCLYAKNFWHLPLPPEPLSNLRLGNGASYEVIEPGMQYRIGYTDPDDGDEIHVDLTFTGVAKPHLLGESHLDQPRPVSRRDHPARRTDPGGRLRIPGPVMGSSDTAWPGHPCHAEQTRWLQLCQCR